MTTVPQPQSPISDASESVHRIGEERMCGITETIHHFPISSYTLKQTCSDFLVNEIGVDGVVVVEREKVVDIEQAPKGEESESLDANVELGKLPISQDIVDAIIAFKESRDESYTLPCAFESKEQRTLVHKTIKSLFQQEIVSETVEGHQIRLIRRSSRRRIDYRDEKKAPSCLVFVMRKEGTDTIGAIHTISKCLRLSSRAFGYAGSKDKRAITTQLVTVRNCEPAKLAGFNKIPNKGIRVSGIRVGEHPLQLGDLQGNKFVITLRDVNPMMHDLQDRISRIKSSGFINYFGLQRFGTQSVKTHTIGVHLLRGDWKRACAAILDPRQDEQGSMQTVRLYWARTGNAAETLPMFPTFAYAERQVLGHLVDSPNDYRGAIGAINRELRMMYVHAVQSYVWNRIVSEHVKQGELDTVVDIPGYDNTTSGLESFLSELDLPPTCFSPTPQNETLWDLRGAKRELVCHSRDLSAEVVGEGTIKVSFSLPPSSYATMLLRELFGSE